MKVGEYYIHRLNKKVSVISGLQPECVILHEIDYPDYMSDDYHPDYVVQLSMFDKLFIKLEKLGKVLYD